MAALVGAASVVLGSSGAAQASPGDTIAPVTAASATTYTQTFARSDGDVTATYTLAGSKIVQDTTSTTAAMNSRGSSVVFSPTGVLNSTGALIDDNVTADCAGGTATTTDCGTSGTITIAFSRPVTNPTLHLSGIGGSQTLSNGTYANFGAYFSLTASTSSSAAANSATLGPLLGTPTDLSLTGGRLQTTGVRPATSCDTNGTTGATSVAGCGSVLVTGTNLTSITLTTGVRNGGAGIDVSQATNTIHDAYLLDASIPDITGPGTAFDCYTNAIYGVDQSDYNVNRIDVTTGAETFIGHVDAAAGTSLNGLAIVNGGGAAYAINRNVTAGGATTVYRLDPVTGATTTYAGPTLTQTTSGNAVVEGALNPVNGIYYFALVGGSGLEIYGFNTNTNTAITGRIAHIPSITGGNGDFAFDRLGRLVFIASSGNGSATANPLYYINTPLPATGNDATLAADLVGYMTPNDSTFNGLAFDLPQGYLYVNSSTGGQSTLRQLNPTSGTEIASHGVTYLGQATNEVSDLASCSYNNSLELQKNIVTRAASSDQFTVSVTGGGLGVAQTGTTSGTSTGVQTAASATAGPFPTLAGANYTITETAGNATTNLSKYITTWRCVNLLDPGTTLVSGTGTTGTVTFPTPTSADGIPLGCYFTNEAIASNISITKTTDQTAYHVGDTVTYTIKVTNTGNSTLTNVKVADATTASCVKTVGTLAAGASNTYTCTATAPVTGNANTATVTGTDPLNATVTATSTVAVPVIRPALTLTKSASPTTVTAAGQTVTYTFGVTNSGDSPVSSIAIADTPVAPGGVPATITCQATTLAAGASTTCTGTYTATQADVDNGTIKDTAVANGKDQLGSTVASNQAAATVTVTQSPALTLTKTATPTTVSSVGATVSYSFLVRNSGNVTITNLAVGDVFDNASVTPPAITCPATTLAPGASIRCTATYATTQSDLDQGSINNTATATGRNPAGTITTSNTSSASVTASAAPSLTLVKTASPTTVTAAGQTVTYSFAVTNTGNQTLSNLAINDTFTAPAGPALVVTCPTRTLAPGATTTCTAPYTVTQADVNAGSIKNAATAQSTNPQGAAVTSAQSNATVTVTRRPALTLVKTANPTTVTAAGATVSYSFLVTNTGNVTLSNLTVADSLAAPAGPELTVNCPVASLNPGANTTCTATYTVKQADVDNGTIKNTATAGTTDPTGAVVNSNTSAATVTVTRSPGLMLVKSATPASVSAVNQTVTYNFQVTNTGNQTITALSVADTFTAPAGPPLTITCPTTTLAVGAVTNCTATYKTLQADLDKGTIDNSAVATGKDPTNATVTSNTSTATVTASQTATLTLTKTASPTTVTAVGQLVNYSFVVTNTGNTTVSTVAVADPMFTGTAAPACPVTTLAPGAATTCTATYTTTQADLDRGRIVNTATATGKDPKNATVTSNTATATVTATQVATLSLTKSATPASVTASGATVTYTFAVRNTGNVTVTGVAITDTFTAPAGPALAPITCATTTLAPGAATTCTASYTVTQADINAGSINNSAAATGKDPGNAAVTSNTSTATVNASNTPKLTLQKSATPATVTAAGQGVTYTFTVTNAGNTTITGVAITDTFTAPAGPALAPITCAATTLAPNASTTCTAAYTATQADVDNGTINNSAVATGKDPANTTITSNASTATVTVTRSASLSLTKTPSRATVTAAGQTVTYTFVVRNTGNVTVTNPTVTDTFTAPAGPEITPTCPAGALAPGATVTCTATYTVTQADVDNGTIRNSAVANAKDPGGNTVSSAPATATVTATKTTGLTVVKAATPTTVTAAGQKINYTFTASNTGNVTLSLLSIADTLTAPAAPVPPVTCPSSTIAPGATVVCTATYTVTQADMDAGSVGNSATASAKDPQGTTITSPPSATSVTATRTATLALTKAASPATVTGAGQVVTYTFTVRNTGNVTVSGVAIADTFTAPAGPALAPITCAATTLAPGASTTCTASYTVTQADVNAGSINNSATASGRDPAGVGVTSNTSTATVTTTAAPGLTLTKTATPTTVTTAGQTVTYTFAVTNTGNVSLSGVAVADPLLAAAPACGATTLAPGASTTCTGTYTVKQSDIDAGSIHNTATASGTTPGNATVTSAPASATVDVTQAPALTVTKTATPTTVTRAGQTVTYTFGVTNTGSVTVHGVNIVDRFTAPAGPPLAPITCAATTLAPNASTTCTATYTVTQADVDKGSIVNTANAAGLDPGNVAVASAPKNATVTVTQTSTITVVKTANPTSATRAGQVVTYSFAVTDTGNTTLTGVGVTDTFAAPAAPPLAVTCAATTLAPGAATTCTGSYTITQADVDAGSVNNSATSTGTNPAGATVTSTPSTATVTIAAGPALALTKTASPTTFDAPNQTITYTFRVTNTGTVTISGVAVTDPMFTGAAAPACAPTTLAPGAAATCTATYTTTQADVDRGSIVNTAAASGTAPGGARVTAPNATATATATQTRALKLVKTAAPQTVDTIGQLVTYSFAVTNLGNVTLHGLTVTDVFAAPATSTATVTCPDTTLSPNETTTCLASYAATAADFDKGSIDNTATAHAADPAGTNVDSNPSTAMVTAVQTPGLMVVKSASPASVGTVGQTVTYTFAVTNNGSLTITDLSIADTFTAPAGPEITPVCTATVLAAGATTTCTATYRTTQADLDNGSIDNSAVAQGVDSLGDPVTSPASTATVTADQAAALTVQKSANPTTVTAAGQPVTYSFLVTNTGTVTVTNVAINDPRLTGAAAPACPGATGPTGPTLAPGATVTCTGTYAVTQADVDAGTIRNTATATGTNPAGGPVTSPQSSATVTATQTPGLSVSKTATPATVGTVGAAITYTITAQNTGNTTLTGVSVRDTLAAPAGPAPALTCPAGTTLAPAATFVCTATYRTTQADIDNGSVTNSAVAAGLTPAGTTLTSDPSTATVTTTQTNALSLVKSVTPTTAAVGDRVTYSFLVTNTGSTTVTGIAIVDTFTAPATPVPTITCPVTTLAPGAATTCTGSYTIKQADGDKGSVVNSAVATGTGPRGAPVTSTASTATVTVPQTSALRLVKAASPTTVTAVGQTVAYTFTVTNTGTVTVANLAIADSFTSPAGPPLAVTCPSTTLAPAAATTCTGTYRVTQGDLDRGAIDNSATATGTDPAARAVTSNTSTATVAATQSAGLSLVKTADPTRVTAAGQTVTYTFAVTNNGTVTVSNLSIADTFAAPAGPGSAVTCRDTTLAPGAATSCTGTYAVSQADVDLGTVRNSAVANGQDPAGNPVASNTSTALVTASQSAALSLTKSAAPTSVDRAGDTIAYSFAVTNTGNVTVTNLSIVDTLAAPAGPALAVTCPVTTLAPAAGTTCTATYTVSQADADYGSIGNSAYATAASPTGAQVPSNTSTATVPVARATSLSLVKTANPTSVTAAGQSVTYSFLVTNTGTTTVSNVVVDDTLTAPAGPDLAVTCPQTTLLPTRSVTCTATYRVTQADVDHGRIDNSATASGTDPTGAAVASNAGTAAVTIARTSSLTLVKTASVTTVTTVGRAVTYSFLVTNTGNTTETGVRVTDVFRAPAGPELTPDCPVTTLLPGTSTTCTASYTVTRADLDNGSISNTATAHGTDPTGAAVDSPTSSVTIAAAQQSALNLVKTALVGDRNGNGRTDLGDTITWSFALSNVGNVTLTGVAVTDPTAGTVTCPVTTLPAGASTTCTAAVHTVSQADVDRGVVTNTATAAGTDPSGATVTSAPSSTTTPIASTTGIRLVKKATPTTVTTVGQQVVYTFTVTNTGTTTLSGVGIDDTLSAPAGPALAVTCPAGALAPARSVDCTATYTVTQADIDHGTVDNSATASATDPTGATVTSTPSTATVTAAQTPKLVLAKSASPASVSAVGDAVTYTFTVTNAGNVTVTGLAIDDTLAAPAGPALDPITCAATALDPGGVTTCTATYTTTQADLDNGSIDNSATVSGTGPAGTVTSAASTATVAVVQSPTLSLVKSAAPTTVDAAGDTVTYTFAVTNTGNLSVHGLTIADQLTAPAGPALAPITCLATVLAPGAGTTCTATYRVTQADVDHGRIDNTATAAGLLADGTTVSSNQSSASVAATQTTGITVVKTADPTTIDAAGDTVTYRFVVHNTGNVTLTHVAVNDTFTTPAGLSLTPTCPATTLAPDATTTCTATYTATQADVDGGVLDNTATATGTPPNGPALTSDPSTAEVTVPADPSITLVKTATPTTVTAIGQKVTYSFAVTNTGNVTLTGVVVTDTLTAPAGPALTPSCPVTTLRPGAGTICTAGYTSTAADFDAGTIDNSAVVTGTPPTGGPVASDPSTATVTTQQAPALRLVKKATVTDLNGNGFADLDDTIQYTFAVTNTGTVTLTNVAVDDALAGAVTCPSTTLAAGASETCTADTAHVISQADVDAGQVDNTATVSGTPPTGPAVTSPPSTTSTPIGEKPALTIVKTGQLGDANDDSAVDAGDQVTWKFVVTNTGNVTLTDVTVTDATAGTVTCAATTLAPGLSTTCTADPHTVTQADVDAGSVSNTATATGTPPGGAAPVTSPPSTATVPLPDDPALTVKKSAKVTDENGDGLTGAGDTVVWQFVVTNTGNVTLTGVAVKDPTAGTVTCKATTLAPGAQTTCASKAHTITDAEAAAGSIKNTATATGNTPSGDPVTSPPSSATVTIDTPSGSGGAGAGSGGTGGSSGGGGSTSSGGGGTVAYTGAKDLPLLVWVGGWSLLVGLMMVLGSLVRRRRQT